MILVHRQLWLILAVETVFFIVLAIWVLTRLDRLLEPASLITALVIIVVGDLVTVLLMQRLAPTRIIFSAGNAGELFGKAVAGFGKEPYGYIVIRGEQWAARIRGQQLIEPGDRVQVVSRGGLTLLVEHADQISDGRSSISKRG